MDGAMAGITGDPTPHEISCARCPPTRVVRPPQSMLALTFPFATVFNLDRSSGSGLIDLVDLASDIEPMSNHGNDDECLPSDDEDLFAVNEGADDVDLDAASEGVDEEYARLYQIITDNDEDYDMLPEDVGDAEDVDDLFGILDDIVAANQ
jgi:hypothetical protein